MKKKNLLFLLLIISLLGIYGYFFILPKYYSLLIAQGFGKPLTFLKPHDPALFFEIGENHFGNGKVYDIQRAKKAYQRALVLYPNFLEAHYQLGRIHFISGEFDSALAEMNKVLELNPEFKRAYYMYGLISGYQGNLDEAIYGFSEFIKRDDFNWAGYNDLAWIYFKKGDYEKTHEVAKKGLEKAPNNPWLNNIYGTALLNLGKKGEAKIAFETALATSETMTPEDWGRSYPGNNPDFYAAGLEETRSVIRHNLKLVSE